MMPSSEPSANRKSLFSRLARALVLPFTLTPLAFACNGTTVAADPWADDPYVNYDGAVRRDSQDSGQEEEDERDAAHAGDWRDARAKDATPRDAPYSDNDASSDSSLPQDAKASDASPTKDSGPKAPNSCASFGGSCVSQAIAESSYCETEVVADDCLPQRPHCCITSACTRAGGECLYDDGSGLVDPCTAIGGTISAQSCGLRNNICCMR